MTYLISDRRVSSLLNFTWKPTMPAKSLEPLKKVTVDLFADDVAWIHLYQHMSFTEFVRDAVRERVNMRKRQAIDFALKPEPFTIGDLEND